MRTLSAAELSVLAGELKELEGFSIDKFYESGENSFRLRLKRGKEKAALQIILSRTINRTKYQEPQSRPSNFAMAVRKRTEGSKIESISQLDGDRIMVIGLEKNGDRVNVIIEMFGGGNLILADGGMVIDLAYRQAKFVDRVVEKGAVYAPPKHVSRRQESANAVRSAVFFNAAGRAVDYSAFGGDVAGLVKKEYATLQEALDDFYHYGIELEQPQESEQERQLRASIEKQKELISKVGDQIGTNKTIAETIFRNMESINRLIGEARKNRRITKEELNAMSTEIKTIEVDLKKKSITIEVD